MNLFIMRFDDISMFYKPQTEEEIYIIDEANQVLKELERVKDILSDYSLTYYDVNMLNSELRELFDKIESLENEVEELSKENKMLEEASDYLKQENDDLRGELNAN